MSNLQFEQMTGEILAQYQILVARQKEEEAEFKRRVYSAQSQLSQKHAIETRNFWTERRHSDRIGGNIVLGPIPIPTGSQQNNNPALALVKPSMINTNPTAPELNRNAQKSPVPLGNHSAPAQTFVLNIKRHCAQKRSEVVDLISDDEDSQPAEKVETTAKPAASDSSVPSASLVSFSGSVNDMRVRDRSHG
jgi:uncharacterized membrane protein